jgi:F0F1-type ATP synthase alpha subunit
LKKLAGPLKLDLAQFKEVEAFSKFGLDMDEVTKQLVDRGSKLTTLLIQNRFSPLQIDKQVLFLYTALHGYLDQILNIFVPNFEEEFYTFYDESIFKYPIKGALALASKTEVFDEDAVVYLI